MSRLNHWKRLCAAFLLCAGTSVSLHAQTFTTIATFDGANGYEPISIAQANDGNFYGVTTNGGQHGGYPGSGTIFRVTPEGALSSLYSFCTPPGCTNGLFPETGLLLVPKGAAYGTTNRGGYFDASCPQGCGTIFRATDGKFTTIYDFCVQGGMTCADGIVPQQPLAQGVNGNLYGTTSWGGGYGYFACSPPQGGQPGCGTIFEVTPTGTFTPIHVFCERPENNRCPDGFDPLFGLTLGTDGNFYGTTYEGGTGVAQTGCPDGCGIIYRLTQAGDLTTLYNFCGTASCPEGTNSSAGVIQGTDGNLYGANGSGGVNGGGTLFKLTPSGKLTVLYSFCSLPNCADGQEPLAQLLEGSDGNFYGVTDLGGTNQNSLCGNLGCGTLFRVTPAGQFTSLYSFCSQANCADGWGAGWSLIQATDGNFYGVTNVGGTAGGCLGSGCGTVFRLSMGLAPFVEARPAFGKARATIEILGNNLTGATGVTFNGTSSDFKVVSSNLIEVEVPIGATSGYVTVTTATGTVTSNKPFYVIP